MGKGHKSSGSNTDPESCVLKAMSHVIWTDISLLNWSTVSGFCQIMSSPVVRVDRGYAGAQWALFLRPILSLDSGLCLRPGSSPTESMTVLCFSIFLSEPGDLSEAMGPISFSFLSWQLCHCECWFPPRVLLFHCRVWAAWGPYYCSTTLTLPTYEDTWLWTTEKHMLIDEKEPMLNHRHFNFS